MVSHNTLTSPYLAYIGTNIAVYTQTNRDIILNLWLLSVVVSYISGEKEFKKELTYLVM